MTSTWVAPSVERIDPLRTSDEREALEAWLDYHRLTLLMKCAGLTATQLKERSVKSSGLSLLGLVRHMAEVERWWFRVHAAGEEIGYLYCTDDNVDADFDDLETADARADLAAFWSEVESSRSAVKSLGLDQVVRCEKHEHSAGSERNIREIYIHMIEEYARHNGHADLLREAIDGQTGD